MQFAMPAENRILKSGIRFSLASPSFIRIFLDGKAGNRIYCILLKLLPGQSGICGFEFIQRAQSSSSSIEEELLRTTGHTKFLSEDFVRRCERALHFN